MMTIKEAQKTVDDWINTVGVRYYNELTNMAILTEEVGEVARIIARQYGEQSFKDSDKGIARHDYEIVDEGGDNIGIVTSGTMSPCLKKAVGMGYVKEEFSPPDSEIYVSVRNKALKAKVVKMPFYK